MAGNAEEVLWGLFTKALIPFVSKPLSGADHLPRAPHPDSIILELGFQHNEFGEDASIP